MIFALSVINSFTRKAFAEWRYSANYYFYIYNNQFIS